MQHAEDAKDDFATRLTRCRKATHVSQGELAACLAVSLATVWRWENRRANPRYTDMRAAARALGVATAALGALRVATELPSTLRVLFAVLVVLAVARMIYRLNTHPSTERTEESAS